MLKNHFEEIYNNKCDDFANGRYVRNLFENALINQANRLAFQSSVSSEDLSTLILEDFRISEHSPIPKHNYYIN